MISAIRKACHATDECFTKILKAIKPGVTEQDIANLITIDLAFPPIIAFGSNTSFIHHRIPSKHKQCRKQEIILIDIGAKVDGYCADMTRMIFVGTPRPEWTAAYKTVLRVQETIIRSIKKSFSGARMDILARTMIEKAGYPPYPHSLGHCIGKNVHEPPKLSRKKDAQITPGMTFTIEPGIYIKGSYGIRIEDTVFLNKNGLEVLTKSPKKIAS